MAWDRPEEVARAVVEHDVLADILRAATPSHRFERRLA